MTPKKNRPQKLESSTIEIPCPCGRVYVTVTEKEGKPFEVFARLGKSGGCGAAVVSAMTSTISIALRSGTEAKDIAKGLISISCHRPKALDGEQEILSCADAVGRALISSLKERE